MKLSERQKRPQKATAEKKPPKDTWRIDDDLWTEIMAYYRKGIPAKDVARLVAIDHQVYESWISHGEQAIQKKQEDTLFWTRRRDEDDLKDMGRLGFVLAIRKAEAEWVSSMLTVINANVTDGVQANIALKALEQRYPQKFRAARKAAEKEDFEDPTRVFLPDNGRD